MKPDGLFVEFARYLGSIAGWTTGNAQPWNGAWSSVSWSIQSIDLSLVSICVAEREDLFEMWIVSGEKTSRFLQTHTQKPAASALNSWSTEYLS